MAQTDREALVALYKAAGGPTWKEKKNWNTDADLSEWHGITTNDQGRVVGLALRSNNLEGHIPPQLGDLGALKHLDLSMNKLDGPIPAGLGNLNVLVTLDLSNNKFSGRIPEELGKLTALQDLTLYKNMLSGPIPPELGNLAALQHLDLDRNWLSGPIPPQLGNLSALRSLGLNNNKLIGSIPPDLGQLAALKKLDLNGNKLTGQIPPQLGDLGALKHLYIDGNNLDGSKRQRCSVQTLEISHCEVLQPRKALWDHSRDVGVRDEELRQGCAVGSCVPEHLEELLAMLKRLRPPNTRIIDNPWEEPPEAVVEKGMRAVSAYFDDLFQEGIAFRRRMIKVVLVGQGGAGKTSLRQSIRARGPAPTSGSDESTVQIDVEEMNFDGVSLRVYDCAGQVAYTGLLQMFLSPRAVNLLVCNSGAFGRRHGCFSDKNQLNRDLVKLQELRVCDWLQSLSLRIPGGDVIVVATKCDQAGGDAADMAKRMQLAIRKWLEQWSNDGMHAVCVEDGVSLTSCVAAEGGGRAAPRENKQAGETVWACDWRDEMRDDFSPSLLHRILYNGKGDLRGAAMVLPRSWNIALEVLEALGSGRDPVWSVDHLLRKADELEGGKRAASTSAKQHERTEALTLASAWFLLLASFWFLWNSLVKTLKWHARSEVCGGVGSFGVGVASVSEEQHQGIEGITRAELSSTWSDVVEALKRDGVNVINPDHALEGALSIREHQGSLVRNETYVFLDVTWLAQILKPLLNHRDDEDPLSGDISLGDTDIVLDNEELVSSWNRFKKSGVLELALARVLWPHGLIDYVLPTLESLGMTHPLNGDRANGLVVLLRLSEERPPDVGLDLDDFRRGHTAVFSVTWKIFMGVPPGAIEKVLMRCCSIGTLQTFWRFGVLVQGCLGGGVAGKTFALLVEYSPKKKTVDMKVYGSIGTAAPWAALSFGVSAVRTMCLDFPGLRWRAYLECPQHNHDMRISNEATRPGDKVIAGKTCSLCMPETGGLGAAAVEFLEIIDVHQSRGDIYSAICRRYVKLQEKYPVLRPEGSRDLHPQQTQVRFDAWLGEVREEIQDVLHGAKASTAEGEKLQQLVGALQQQLEQQHHDVREWIGALGHNSSRLVDAIEADDGVMGRLDFLVTMLMAMRKEGSDTPRHACVLPPWEFAETHGLSDYEQRPEVWMKQLDEWKADDFKDGKGVFTKEKRLFLVCAHTHKLVPCGPIGQGYKIQQNRTWFRMSVNVTTFALQVMCSTLSAMAVAPLSGVGAAVEAVSAAVGNFESMLHDQLAERADKDAGADMDMAYQTADLDEGVYASLRDFVHGEEYTACLKMFKATKKAHRERRAPPSSSEFVFFEQGMTQVQNRGGDAAVQWVLKGQEQAWYNANRSAPIS